MLDDPLARFPGQVQSVEAGITFFQLFNDAQEMLKRIVAEEIKDTTSAGRVLRHERIELEKYEVR